MTVVDVSCPIDSLEVVVCRNDEEYSAAVVHTSAQKLAFECVYSVFILGDVGPET